MKKLIIKNLFLVISIFVASVILPKYVIQSPLQANAASSSSLQIIGGGLFENPLYAALQRQFPNASVYGQRSTTWSQGLGMIDSSKDTIVFALGREDTLSNSDLDAVINAVKAKGSQIIFLLDYSTIGRSTDANNKLIKAYADDPNHKKQVHYVDWNTPASQNKSQYPLGDPNSYFDGNYNYVNGNGANVLTNLIANAVSATPAPIGGTGTGSATGGLCIGQPGDAKGGACNAATSEKACSSLVGFNCSWVPATQCVGPAGDPKSGACSAATTEKACSSLVGFNCSWVVNTGVCQGQTGDPKAGACSAATSEKACSSLVGFNCSWTPINAGGGNTGGGNTGGGNTGGGNTGGGNTGGGSNVAPTCSPIGGGTPATSNTPVTIIGDSITVGAQDTLKKLLPNASIDAEVGRQWITGLHIIDCLNNKAAVPASFDCNTVKINKIEKTLVFALGTNGPFSANDITTIKKEASGSRVIFMTIYGPMSYTLSLNNMLTTTVNKEDIADWNKLASDNKDLFNFAADPQGIHPNARGSDAFAQLIFQTIGGGKLGQKPPDYPADLQTAILNQFGVTLINFDDLHYKWMWDALWGWSNTKMNGYIKGIKINGVRQNWSQFKRTCPGSGAVSLDMDLWNPQDNGGVYATEAYFIFNLSHELGHLISYCEPANVSHVKDQLNAMTIEGPISYYAAHAVNCGGDNGAEDYADMVAYYLNPDAGLSNSLVSCGPTSDTPPNPYYKLSPNKQNHLNVVTQVF